MQTSIYVGYSDFLNDDELFSKYYAFQSEKRKTKIDAFKFREGKNSSLLVGILLNKLIRENNIKKYELSVSENGKPFEKNKLFYFSITHSQNIVAVAFSDTPVGIDLEINTNQNRDNIAERFFSEIDKYNLHNGIQNFLEIWTRKESYTKLKDIELTEVLKKPEDSSVFFKTIITDNYTLSICTENKTEYCIKELDRGMTNV